MHFFPQTMHVCPAMLQHVVHSAVERVTASPCENRTGIRIPSPAQAVSTSPPVSEGFVMGVYQFR
jgi:hypothetical protein